MENHERYLTIKRYLLGEVDEHKAHMRQAMKDNNHVGYEHAEDRIHYLTHLLNNLKDDLKTSCDKEQKGWETLRALLKKRKELGLVEV